MKVNGRLSTKQEHVVSANVHSSFLHGGLAWCRPPLSRVFCKSSLKTCLSLFPGIRSQKPFYFISERENKTERSLKDTCWTAKVNASSVQLNNIKLHRYKLIFNSHGRNVHCCEAVTIHIIDPCKVVNVCGIVEKPDGIIWDKVTIHHRIQLYRAYSGIWKQGS